MLNIIRWIFNNICTINHARVDTKSFKSKKFTSNTGFTNSIRQAKKDETKPNIKKKKKKKNKMKMLPIAIILGNWFADRKCMKTRLQLQWTWDVYINKRTPPFDPQLFRLSRSIWNDCVFAFVYRHVVFFVNINIFVPLVLGISEYYYPSHHITPFQRW